MFIDRRRGCVGEPQKCWSQSQEDPCLQLRPGQVLVYSLYQIRFQSTAQTRTDSSLHSLQLDRLRFQSSAMTRLDSSLNGLDKFRFQSTAKVRSDSSLHRLDQFRIQSTATTKSDGSLQLRPRQILVYTAQTRSDSSLQLGTGQLRPDKKKTTYRLNHVRQLRPGQAPFILHFLRSGYVDSSLHSLDQVMQI